MKCCWTSKHKSTVITKPSYVPKVEPAARAGDMARGGETAKVASHLWNRWRKTSLTERHNLAHQTGKIKVTRGDVVIVKTDDKNRGILLSSHARGETENCQIKFREICSAPLPAGTCKREHPSRNKAAEPRSSSFPVQKESCSRCQRADSKDCRPWQKQL